MRAIKVQNTLSGHLQMIPAVILMVLSGTAMDAGPSAVVADMTKADIGVPRRSEVPHVRHKPGPKTIAIREDSVTTRLNLSAQKIVPGLNIGEKRHFFGGRFGDVMSDPSNLLIPRCKHAGKTVIYDGDEVVVMSNGVIVTAKGYYNSYSAILWRNAGVHEAAEERLFSAIVDRAPPGSAIVELGAFWAFYSVWYSLSVPDARTYCVEYDKKNVVVGKRNFALNNVKATNWTLGFVKEGWLKPYLEAAQVPRDLHMMLVDIQGYEEKLIPDLAHAIVSRSLRINYLMIGTHSPKVHNATLRMVSAIGWRVVGQLDHDQTFFYDGMVVATPIPESKGGLPSMELGDRRRTPRRDDGIYESTMTGEPCEFLPDELAELLDVLPNDAGKNGKAANAKSTR